MRVLLILAVLLTGCGGGGSRAEAAATTAPTLEPTTEPTPEPTQDAEAAYRDAMCQALVESLPLPDNLTAVAEAVSELDQAALEKAYAEMSATLTAMRDAATEAPIWEPGEEAKVSMIRVTNDLDSIVKSMVDAATWEDALGHADELRAVNDQLNDAMARMDSLGFDRGGNC